MISFFKKYFLLIFILYFILLYIFGLRYNFQIIVSIGVIIALIANGTTIFNQFKKGIKLIKLSKLTNDTYFVNRSYEINEIIKDIKKNKLINIYGAKGVGKSEVLKLLSDYINDNLNEEFKTRIIAQSNSLKDYICFYYDISDKTGILDIKEELVEKTFINNTNEQIVFARKLNDNLKNKFAVIILDNLNNSLINKDINNLIMEHIKQRPHDKFIIGSIKPFIIQYYTEDISSIKICPLQDDAVREYISKRGFIINKSQADLFITNAKGLPLYLNILVRSKEKNIIDYNLSLASFKDVIINIIKELDIEAKRTLYYITYLNLSETDFSPIVLTNFSIKNLSKNLDILEDYSLIIKNEFSTSTFRIKVHDIIKDILIELDYCNKEKINFEIFNYYKCKNQKKALLHLILSDKKKILNFADFILKELSNQTTMNNYIFILTLSQMFLERNIKSNIEVFRRMIYLRALSFTKIGEYKLAKELFDNIDFSFLNIEKLYEVTTEDSFLFHFLIADIEHLLNNYNIAIELFLILEKYTAFNPLLKKYSTQCTWILGHLNIHIANLELSMYYHNKNIKEFSKNRDIYSIKSLNEQMVVNILINNLEFDFSKSFKKISKEIKEKSNLQILYSNSLRYIARYYKINGLFDKSQLLINQSREIVEQSSERTVYNVIFYQADLFRAKKEYILAFNEYKKVLTYTRNSDDKNLMIGSYIGIILCELALNKLLYFKNNEEREGALYKLLFEAEELSIITSVLRIKIILDYLKGISSNIELLNEFKKYNLNRDIKIFETITLNNILKMEIIVF